MIQSGSLVKVVDNSGAKTAKCIKVLGGYKKRVAKTGDLIVVAIQTLRISNQKAYTKKKVLKLQSKDIFKALVIKTKQNIDKRQNIKYNFKENCIVLMDKQENPIGTRIFGFISKRIKKKYSKFVTLSLKKFVKM
jgi:large subunit ribosomal protein L14